MTVLRVTLAAVFIATLLATGLPPQTMLAQQEMPQASARLSHDGLLAAPRAPSVVAETSPQAPEAAVPSGLADWSQLVFQSARNDSDWEIYGARETARSR